MGTRQRDSYALRLRRPLQPTGLSKRVTTLIEDAIKVGQKPSWSLPCFVNIALANPGWTAISTIFVSRYLLGQTNSFYAQYPSQASFPSVSLPPADPAETEDCLFLDVKVPASSILNQKAKNYRAPVLVWIHGGGYTVGYKSQYSADSLLTRSRTSSDNGIIFVQINYRVSKSTYIANK